MLVMKYEFGEWLREQIKLAGTSQAEFADQIGIKQPQLSRIISGERGASSDVLERIATLLGLPTETVYRKAGLLPEGDFRQVAAEVLGYKLDELTPSQLDELIEYIEFMQRRDARSGGKRTSYTKPVREGEAPPEVVKGKD